MATVSLTAQKRENLSNSFTKEQRRKGLVPGVFYQKNSEPISIFVKETSLNHFIYSSEVNLINLDIEGSEKPLTCILKDIQFDPVTDKAIHFDLLGISEMEKIRVEVPFQITGSAIGVRDGGILQQTLHTVEIECLPKDIPPHIEVDISNLKIGDALHLSDIKQEGFEIMDNLDITIVAVVPPAAEKEETAAQPDEAASEEPEVIAKGKKEEEEEK
ncbi:MAG: 50S ribosomal protein L25 [Ignavibacteria bacterium]|nr:50S ribosomal protein L25 [Ignavibacteria bacterium]